MLGKGFVGVGTTSPFARLSVESTVNQTDPLFALDYSSTGEATSSAVFVASNGLVGIGITSPTTLFSIESVSGTTTSTYGAVDKPTCFQMYSPGGVAVKVYVKDDGTLANETGHCSD